MAMTLKNEVAKQPPQIYGGAYQPDYDCTRCPRLCDFHIGNRQKFPQYHNGPVPSFGALHAKILIVGLAPGLHGANATGRPFTGDYAGDLLYDTLKQTDLAKGDYQKHADDGFSLIETRITNAVRCVPPQNKPVAEEINNCRPFLKNEIAAMHRLKVIFCLGSIAHKSVVKTLQLKQKDYPFGHGSRYRLENGPFLISSYHCSRYNTSTKRLTPQMFLDVVSQVKQAAAL